MIRTDVGHPPIPEAGWGSTNQELTLRQRGQRADFLIVLSFRTYRFRFPQGEAGQDGARRGKAGPKRDITSLSDHFICQRFPATHCTPTFKVGFPTFRRQAERETQRNRALNLGGFILSIPIRLNQGKSQTWKIRKPL